MIVDYRIYATAYALCCLAWVATIPFMHFKDHHFVNRWMGSVACAAVVLAFFQFLDWLWS